MWIQAFALELAEFYLSLSTSAEGRCDSLLSCREWEAGAWYSPCDCWLARQVWFVLLGFFCRSERPGTGTLLCASAAQGIAGAKFPSPTPTSSREFGLMFYKGKLIINAAPLQAAQRPFCRAHGETWKCDSFSFWLNSWRVTWGENWC